MTTGWMPIDPILSILVGVPILRSAWFLARDAAHVLLKGVPPRLHARVAEGTHPDSATAAIQARLADRFDIRHVTVQIELGRCRGGDSARSIASAAAA